MSLHILFWTRGRFLIYKSIYFNHFKLPWPAPSEIWNQTAECCHTLSKPVHRTISHAAAYCTTYRNLFPRQQWMMPKGKKHKQGRDLLISQNSTFLQISNNAVASQFVWWNNPKRLFVCIAAVLQLIFCERDNRCLLARQSADLLQTYGNVWIET